jgi:hypothetical protein
MADSTIRFTCFPRTEPPPEFVYKIVDVFREHENRIGTARNEPHLKSDEVMQVVQVGLESIGFYVERSKRSEDVIDRPVFFGEGGVPTLRYEVDAYHPGWQCGLEIEAVRGIRGGAFYRDLIQAMVMVGISHLCVALQNKLLYGKAGRNEDYRDAVRTADALYGHSRVKLPFGLTVIGY